MYTIKKPVKLEKVIKLDVEEILLVDNIYYIKSLDTFYSADKSMFKKIAFVDRNGLCIKAYRELEDMQLLTRQGITTIKYIKVIEVEEVKDVAAELKELLDNKTKMEVDSEVKDSIFDYTEEELDEIFDSKIEFKKEMDHLDKAWEEEFGKSVKKRDMYCPNCCGTCLDCPYIDNSEYNYEFFLGGVNY